MRPIFCAGLCSGLPSLFLLLGTFVLPSSQLHFTLTGQQANRTYDYIFCGGGTAGLAVASRLAQTTSAEILVVEAGDVPGVITPSRLLSFSWNYVSESEMFAGNRSLTLYAGKVLGGSSQINGQVYLRGEKRIFDSWVEAGNDGWDWDSVFPYYLASENFTAQDSTQQAAGVTSDSSLHGTHGAVDVRFPVGTIDRSISDALDQSFTSVGITRIPDPNGGSMRGFSSYPSTIQNLNGFGDVRESANSAYYDPIATMTDNLHVLVNTTAVRIVWADGSNGSLVATGVEIANMTTGEMSTINATSEVVLTAGAYRSSTILEYSGVGDPEVLKSAGVDVKMELPGVGNNLIDQTNNMLNFSLRPDFNLTGIASFAAFANVVDLFGEAGSTALGEEVRANLSQYASEISSRYNGAISADTVQAYLQSQYDSIFGDSKIPIVEYLVQMNVSAASGNTIVELWNLQPFSRGSVHISTPSPLTQGSTTSSLPDLSIVNNFFMLEYDRRVQVQAARFIRDVYARQPLTQAYIGEELGPGLRAVPQNATDAEWFSWIVDSFRNEWHFTGTTAMASKERGGVVNAQFQVHGTSNVRVVDGGVQPYLQNGHPTATIYAIAERAAKILQEAFKYKAAKWME